MTQKGTGDPLGSPAPSPLVWRHTSRTPASLPIPGHDRETLRVDHTISEATRSFSISNRGIGDPHGCPLETALIPIRSAKTSTVRSVPDGV
jgi:hypothetical protein